MKQNIYDNPIFYQSYINLREEGKGLNDVLEIPVFRSLLPDLHNKKVLDLGCGFGESCKWYVANFTELVKRVYACQYPTNISEINVVWKNDTDKDLTFGNPFTIQKSVVNKWKAIGNKGAVFTSIGYRVAPHSEMKHSYNIRL